MRIKASILFADRLTKIGPHFSHETISEAVQDYNSRRNGHPFIKGTLVNVSPLADDGIERREGLFDLKEEAISHEIIDLKLEGDMAVAEVEILDTKLGKRVQNLLKENRVVFRPVGFGCVERNEVKNYSIQEINAFREEDDWYGGNGEICLEKDCVTD